MQFDPENTNARDVVERLLETSGSALETNDFTSLIGCYLMPFQLETFDGCQNVQTSEQARSIFEAVQTVFRAHGITHVDRNCLEAEFKDENTLEATYETRMIAGQQLVERAYPVFVVIVRTEAGWKIASQVFAMADAPSLSHAIVSATK